MKLYARSAVCPSAVSHSVLPSIGPRSGDTVEVLAILALSVRLEAHRQAR